MSPAPATGPAPDDARERPTLVVAHPSAELYGSDRMLLESVVALVPEWSVVVLLPEEGPLAQALRDRGVLVRLHATPVLRKALLRPRELLRFAYAVLRSTVATVRLLRRLDPGLVYVNTLTVPVWLWSARLARVPVLCHVHEAEENVPRALQTALALPLLLAPLVLVNSRASGQTLTAVLPVLRRRVEVLYNGVAGPQTWQPPRLVLDAPVRLVVVGRLSPRKGSDVAVQALARLRAEGREVRLTLVGSVFPGYEWFERDLREAGTELLASGALVLAGFRSEVWDAFGEADVVLVPSREEPFGNVAVEGMLAERPVVASAAQGLQEIVVDGTTGLLVPPGDAAALAAAVAGLLDDWGRARELAAAGHRRAVERFGTARYAEQLRATARRWA